MKSARHATEPVDNGQRRNAAQAAGRNKATGPTCSQVL